MKNLRNKAMGNFAPKMEIDNAIASESYAEALEYSEQASAVAAHPWNGMGLLPSKVMRRLEEGLLLLKQQSDRLNADGVLYISNLTDPVAGVAKVFNGNVAEGINWIERAILRREQERARHFADWYRLILSEIYLQALLGKEKPPRFGLCSKTYRSF